MARRREAKKRKVLPDPLYHEELVSRFINAMMLHGKKGVAEKQFYGALRFVEEQGGPVLKEFGTSLGVFKAAVENTKPLLEVKSRRVGGSNYQVPIEVASNRQQALAIRWLIDFSRKKSGRGMMEKLAGEFIDAAQKRGATIKKREEIHKMAEANKAFAHYRW